MNIQQQSRFLLEQKITPLINRYNYYSYAHGTKGDSIAFVEQKRFKFKEEMTAWADSSKTGVLFTLKAESVMDIHGKFNVTSADGENVGYLKKVFGKSLLRSTWEVHSAQDELLFICQERNLPIAILRRLGGLIPIIGELFELLPYNFNFERDGKQVGGYTRVFALRDTYDVQIEDPKVDRLLILALGIALDALQAR